MQGRFEHTITQQLSDFKLQPSYTVWQGVNAALHPERKRRLLIWWWLPLLGFVITSLAYWLFTNTLVNKRQVVVTGKNINQTFTKPTIDTFKIGTDNIIFKAEKEKRIYQPILKIKQKLLAFNLQPNKKNFSNIRSIASNNNINITSLIANNNPITASITASDTETNKNDISKSVTIASTQIKDLTTTTIKQIIDSLTTENDKKIIIQAARKNQWFITAGGGFLNLASNQNNNSRFAFANSTVVPPNGSTITTQQNIANPNNGFEVSVGIINQITLSEKMAFSTGVQYNYLTNQQAIGQDTAGQFAAGKTYSKANYAHLFKVPFCINYKLNKSPKNQFDIEFGSSVSWAFSEKWLIANNLSNKLFYDGALNNKWQLGVHGSLSFYKTNRYKIAIVTSYNLTPIYKATVSHHFVQYGLQLYMPILIKPTSSTKK